MIEVFKLLEGVDNVDCNQLFSAATSARCPERTRDRSYS